MVALGPRVKIIHYLQTLSLSYYFNVQGSTIFNLILPLTKSYWFVFSISIFVNMEMKCMRYNFHEFCLNSFCKSNFLKYRYRANNRSRFLRDENVFVVEKFGWVWHHRLDNLKMINNYWESKVKGKSRVWIWTLCNSSANCTLSRIGLFLNNKRAEFTE